MKKIEQILNTLGITSIVLLTLLFCILTAEAIFMKGVPFTWTLHGQYVEDENYISGRYYQVNDSLRIIVTGTDPDFYMYTVFLFENNKWIKTSSDGYVSQFKSKNRMTKYLRSCYNDYLDNRDNELKLNNKLWWK